MYVVKVIIIVGTQSTSRIDTGTSVALGHQGSDIYDENAVKTVSKCLARMKSCWGPEFELSVEDVVDYR